MEKSSHQASPGPEQRHATREAVFVQFVLGLLLHLFLALPFLRRTHGLGRLSRGRQHLFVVNHISLLDTLLLSRRKQTVSGGC